MSATWEKIFEIASHVTHPYSVAACAAVLTTIALVIVRNKHPRIATALAVFIFVLGISPLVATTGMGPHSPARQYPANIKSEEW